MRVVVNGENREFKNFDTEEEAEEYKNQVLEKLGDKVEDLKVGLVYEEPQPLPEDESMTKEGKLWCPFCGTHRNFNREELPDDRCEYCGITVNDYDVKKENSLFTRG